MLPAGADRPRRARCRPDIVDILMRNTRLPQSAMGDLNGQLDALDLGVRRMDELAGRIRRRDRPRGAGGAQRPGRGADARRAFDRCPMAAGRPRISSTMTASPTCRCRSRWRSTIARRPAGAGFRGHRAAPAPGRSTSPCPPPIATCYVAIKHIFPDVPANAGVLRPIELRIPDGLAAVGRVPRSPVGGYTETILRMIDVIFSAAAQAAPERVVANAYGTINALSIAGKRGNGARWVMFCFFGGGHGGIVRGRRAEPRQRADLDRDDPAAGDPRSRLSGDVPAMGAAAATARGAGTPSRRSGRGLRDRAAGGNRRGVPLRRARPLRARAAWPAAARRR